MQSDDRKFVRRWTSNVGEFAIFETGPGLEMHRERCPHHQCWLLLSGSWSEVSSSRRTLVRSGEFRSYKPFEQNKRAAEATTLQVGFRLFDALPNSFEWPAHRTLWQIANALVEGKLDEFSFDEAMTRLVEIPYQSKTKPSWLDQTEAILHDPNGIELSLSELAFEVGITPGHLCASFQKHFGLTVSQYRRRVMLERAIAHREYSPIEHGFYDASHFHRTCKSELGLSPREITRILANS